MTALIDLDILLYRAAFGIKGDFIQMIERMEQLIDKVVTETKATDYRLILSSATNFRKELSPEYKKSRNRKPPCYYELCDYSIRHLSAERAPDGLEADDYLGILQDKDTIICSSDKDLLMIPGLHYRIKKHWNHNNIVMIEDNESIYNFFRQVLMGDTADDIEGLRGVGEVRSKKYLDGIPVYLLRQKVQDLYYKQYGEGWFEKYDLTCKLVWIKRDNKEYSDYV